MTTKDFYTDATRQRRIGRTVLVVVLVGMVAGAIALALMERKKRTDAIAATTAAAGVSTIAGPPCPTLTAEEFAPRAAKTDKVAQFNDDTYARRSGHMDCNLVALPGVKDPVPVCQFTSPQVIAITTAKGSWYFAPGVGQPATIQVPDEVPACVVASNFRG